MRNANSSREALLIRVGGHSGAVGEGESDGNEPVRGLFDADRECAELPGEQSFSARSDSSEGG